MSSRDGHGGGDVDLAQIDPGGLPRKERRQGLAGV
jgi:hypothetical protein